MRVAVKNHALPVYKKNRIASLLCIFESTITSIMSTKHLKLPIGIKRRLYIANCLYLHDSYVGPQNAPLHNMLLLVAYCVPCIHNMLRWSILCTLHTQYATRGAYCVGSVHMLFQWSSEGTQYALLENMSRSMFAFLSKCPLDIHLSILRT